MVSTDNRLDEILAGYQTSFIDKVYSDENNEYDLLMQAFGITPELKRENRQYWGRELGKCWESLIVQASLDYPGFRPALRVGGDEPCDLILDDYAIDAKYRVGSGDSGTLKKFRDYGALLREMGYRPVLLFLRDDNLPAAMQACRQGGWKIHIGQESFDFIEELTGYDLREYLIRKSEAYLINR